MPNTPAKKNKSRHSTDEIYSPFANILHFSEETQEDSGYKSSFFRKMKVTTEKLQKLNRLITDFQVLSKIGEGSFGEVFKVRSNSDGNLYAVKKMKQKYLGYMDRDWKLSEVHKALKI